MAAALNNNKSLKEQTYKQIIKSNYFTRSMFCYLKVCSFCCACFAFSYVVVFCSLQIWFSLMFSMLLPQHLGPLPQRSLRRELSSRNLKSRNRIKRILRKCVFAGGGILGYPYMHMYIYCIYIYILDAKWGAKAPHFARPFDPHNQRS